MRWKKEANEPFWKYFKCFKNLLIQCPHHGIEKWQQCQILYDGIDYQNKTLPETICGGRFLKKWTWRVNNLWRFSRKNLTMGTFQWRVYESQLYLFQRGLHLIQDSIATEAKLANIMRRLEVLETKDLISINQFSPTPSAGCTYCQGMNHVFEECPRVHGSSNVARTYECSILKAQQQCIFTHVQSQLEKSSKFLMGPKHQRLS